MSGFVIIFLLSAITGSSQAKPQIISSPEVIGVFSGQAAMLRCQILNPQGSVVSWSSVTYNFKIFQGSQFLADDAIRYSLINVAGGQIYNLQILNIEKSDQGFYKCAIEGTDQQIITQLKVLDRPNMLLPEGSNLNVTECCLAERISKSCLPVCYPSQIDLKEFNLTTNCGTVENIKGLSKCLTGGSNHDNCCLNKKVKAPCLDMCHNSVPENASMDYFNKCFADNVIQGIFSCFEIGFESLPSEPENVSALAVCDAMVGDILVKWAKPTKNPQKVTGYKIMYKPTIQETYNSILIKNPKVDHYLINSAHNMILSDMNYKLRISALAYNGVSFESGELDVYVPNCTFPEKQNTSIIAKPTNLVATFVENSTNVLLTWDMNSDDSYSNFAIFYKTLIAEQYTVVSNITTKFYKLTDLIPLTEYTVYIVACGNEGSCSQQSANVNFVSAPTGSTAAPISFTEAPTAAPTRNTNKQTGSTAPPTGSIDKQTDDDLVIKVVLAVGISISVICLAAITILAGFLFYKARFQGSMNFVNPAFNDFQDVKVDKPSKDGKQSDILDIKYKTSLEHQ